MCRREDVDGAGVVCGEEGARQAEGEGRAAGRRAADGEACDAGGVGGAHALEEARVDAHRVLEHDDAGHARARGGEGGDAPVVAPGEGGAHGGRLGAEVGVRLQHHLHVLGQHRPRRRAALARDHPAEEAVRAVGVAEAEP